MEPLSREFKLFSAKLNNMIITKGPLLIDQNIGFGDPFSVRLANNIGEVEGFVLNHEYNKCLCSNTFESEFLSVRKELNDNSKNALIKDNLSYIQGILNLYQRIEQNIIEQEDGSYCADFIKYEDCDLTDVKNDPYGNYDVFLRGLKDQLRQEILFLLEILTSISASMSENSKNERDDFKSFQLLSKEITEEKLKEFKENLELYGLIEKIDFRLFANFFGNTVVDYQIVWKTKPTELYYILKTLREKKIIKASHYWKTTARCFRFKLEVGHEVELTAKYISHVGPPPLNLGDRYKILNTVLSCLI